MDNTISLRNGTIIFPQLIKTLDKKLFVDPDWCTAVPDNIGQPTLKLMLYTAIESLQLREYLPIHLTDPTSLDTPLGTRWIMIKSLFEPRKFDIFVIAITNPFIFKPLLISLRWDNTIYPEQLIIRSFFNNHLPIGSRTWDIAKSKSSLNKQDFKHAETSCGEIDTRPSLTTTQNTIITFNSTSLNANPIAKLILEKCRLSALHNTCPHQFFIRSKRFYTTKFFILIATPSLHGLTIKIERTELYFARIYPLSNTPFRPFFKKLESVCDPSKWINLFEDEVQILNEEMSYEISSSN